MNQREWKLCNESNKYEWYNKTRKIQKSFQYNQNTAAVVIHHLRDTEEQRKYNDERYELWGHNLDGTFEYGKYVVFVTKEEHNEIHRCSEETRLKRSEALSGEKHPMYGKHHSEETKRKIGSSSSGDKNHNYGKPRDRETCRKISESNKLSMTAERRKFISNYRSGSKALDLAKERMRKSHLGKKISDDTRKKISASNKGREVSDKTRKLISNSIKRNFEENPQRRKDIGDRFRGKHLSDEHKQKLKDSHADFSGEKGPFYGKHHTEESKKKLTESCKSAWTDEMRHSQSIKMSAIAKRNQSSRSILYYEYKSKGGLMKWNQFQANLQTIISEYGLGEHND